jgi:DHA1 family bicyclomycin/chloramphenicol resistance-like MFS transporter
MRVLLAARLLQGAGAAGGPVMAFAIIRDLFEGPAARARLATVSLVFSLAPVIAPTLGGWMLLLGGWRAIYGLLALTGAALVLAALVGLRESRRRAPPHPHVAILRQGSTVAYALIGGLHQGCVFAFVAGSPLVLLGSMQLSTQVFGAVFGLITLGILAGAATNGVLVRRGVASAVPLGGGLLLAAAAGGLGILLDRWGMLDLYTLTPLMAVITFSRGLVSPNITHAALERVPHMAGAGASLIGSLQMLNGALAGWIVGLMFTVFGPVGMCMTMAAFAVPALLGWVGIARSRYAV